MLIVESLVMNCPQCHEPVGDDCVWYGDWEDLIDIDGNVVGIREPIAILCAHCGAFEADLGEEGRLANVRGPIKGETRLRRLEKRIPACRNDRRLPA